METWEALDGEDTLIARKDILARKKIQTPRRRCWREWRQRGGHGEGCGGGRRTGRRDTEERALRGWK